MACQGRKQRDANETFVVKVAGRGAGALYPRRSLKFVSGRF
jgi:hypothetical protein